MFQLGDKVKDKITGFEGIIVAIVHYLTGCSQYGIKPTKLSDTDRPQDAYYMNIHQVELVEAGSIKIDSVSDTKDPSGPQEHPEGD